MTETRKDSRIVVDMRIQYGLHGKTHEGRMTYINPDGCRIEGDATVEIGDTLFTSFEKGIPLGGFKSRVIGQTLQDNAWKIGVYFVDMTEEEKAMLFDRITYFSFLQDKAKQKLKA